MIFNVQAFGEIEMEPAIRGDVAVDERRQPTPVLRLHRLDMGWIGQHLLQHEGIDVDQADLQQVQG